MATTIKKGQIKRKVSSTDVEVLHPETNADIVLYSKTIEGTAVTNVKDALDKIVTGIGVTGVKGHAETDYRTGNVNLTPANLGIALDTRASGDNASNKDRIEVGTDRINVVTTDTTQAIDSPKTFNAQVNFTTYDINFTSAPQLTILNGKFKSSTTGSHGLVLPDTSSLSSDKTFATTDDITTAINALDVPASGTGAITGFGAGKTLASLTETDGKVAATFQDISITSSQISDKTDSYSSTGTTAVTGKAIAAALGTLDTSSNVAPAVVSGSSSSQKITFKDISESNGIIAAGNNITNAVTYTDSAIDSLLGTKVDKLTSGNKVYVHNGSTQTDVTYGTTATANYIVQRDSSGQITVPDTPTADGHAASKKYVDNKITSGAEYLGIVDNTTELYALDSSAGEGDWVRVGTQFTYSSETCHVGDILICSAAKGSSTHATWDVLHTEVDTDTNTTYQAIVGAAGTGYAGTILLQKKELGQSSYTTQDTIKYINGNGITITPDTTNKTLTIGHSNSISAQTTAKIFKTAIDAQGHITSATAATGSDLNALGAVLDTRKVTASGVLSNSSTGALSADVTITHNQVNTSGAQTTAKVWKQKLDAYGHVTEATAATAADVGVSLTTTAGSEAITVGSNTLNVVTRDTAQNISGIKTLTSGQLKFKSTNSGIQTIGTLSFTNTGDSDEYFSFDKAFRNEVIGADYLVVNNVLDFYGVIKQGDIDHGLVIPSNMSSWSADRTIATTDDLNNFVSYTNVKTAAANRVPVFSDATGKVIQSTGTVRYLAINHEASGTGAARYDLLSVNGSDGAFVFNTGYYGTSTADRIYGAFRWGGAMGADLGTSDYKWRNLYLSGNLSDGTNSDTVANIIGGLTTSIISGKKANGSTDITSSKSGKTITLGDSGITAGTYSAIQVNAKGIAVAGGQILDVIAHGGTPNVVNGGWYFEEMATA